MYLGITTPGYWRTYFPLETYSREVSEINTDSASAAFLEITNNIHQLLPLLSIQSSAEPPLKPLLVSTVSM